MVGLGITVRVEGKNRLEFLQAWEMLAGTSEGTGSCVRQTLYENTAASGEYLWLEIWDDTDSLEKHMRSDRFRSLIGVIEVLGELNAVQNYDITSQTGWPIFSKKDGR
jgi:quinol monooxygenase YgiN